MKKYIAILSVFALVIGFSFMGTPKAEAGFFNWGINIGFGGGNYDPYGYDPYSYGGYNNYGYGYSNYGGCEGYRNCGANYYGNYGYNTHSCGGTFSRDWATC